MIALHRELKSQKIKMCRYPFEMHVLAWAIGATFVALAIPLSLQDIHMHVLHYVSPLQVHARASKCVGCSEVAWSSGTCFAAQYGMAAFYMKALIQGFDLTKCDSGTIFEFFGWFQSIRWRAGLRCVSITRRFTWRRLVRHTRPMSSTLCTSSCENSSETSLGYMLCPCRFRGSI